MVLYPDLHPYTSPGVTGEVLCWRGVPSQFMAHRRDVLIWLPPGYHDAPTRRFPTLYLTDGQNKFDAATSFAGVDWNVDGVATALLAAGQIEAPIMVAIYNSPERLPEYNPLDRGGSYGRFLVEELKPAIDAHFRTEGGRGSALMGSSMGGLISMALLWWYPQHFFGAACLSPSLWILWRDGGPLAWLRRHAPPPQPSWLYMDHGTLGYEGRMRPLVRDFLAYAAEIGFARSRRRHVIATKAAHDEASWQARVDDPLRFLFAPRVRRQRAPGGPV